MNKTATALRAIEKKKVPEAMKNRLRILATYEGVTRDGIADDPDAPPPPTVPTIEEAKTTRAIEQAHDALEIVLLKAKGIADVLCSSGDLEDAESGAAWAISGLIEEAKELTEELYRKAQPFLPNITFDQRCALMEEERDEKS